MKQKLLSILTLLLCVCSGAWAQTLIEVDNMETTSGSGSSLTVSGFSKNDCTISQSTEARTGSYSLKTEYSGNGTKYVTTTNTSMALASGEYLHCIGWAKLESSDGATPNSSSYNAAANPYFGGNGTRTAQGINQSTWTQFTGYYKASSAKSGGSVRLERKHNDKKAVLFDDVVIYKSTNATADIVAPTAATDATATISAISWTNGSDANTGIQNTLIWRRTSGSANDLTINAQGVYAVNDNDQSGHWTLVNASVAADATSYSGTFTSGDVYAVVHRDLAYNYSTPAYLTVVAAAPTYTITLDDNGDYNGNGTATATEGSAILTDIVAPTRDGYTVEGYYKEEACTNKIADAEGNLQADTDYTDEDGNWTSTSDEITLFTKWEEAAKYTVTHTLTNLTTSSGATGDNAATQGVEYTAVFAPSAYYSLPASITVTIGGEAATEGTAYTWNSTTGEVVVGASYVQGAIVITAAGVRNTLTNAPTITAGDFNFENKGYAVTITNNEEGSTLKYSTDNETWNDYTGTLYATTTTHYYAKSVKDNYDDSEVADKNVTNTFDSEKKYIAWVYTKGYGSAGYTFAADPMVIALQSIYNVVEVDGGTSAPNADWKEADLIVCTEAMQGDNNLSNGIVGLLDETTPMIGLKVYNYGAGNGTNPETKRWKWGTPANPSETVYGFTPKSNLYKLLDGVTFESDGTIKLATGRYNTENQKNVVQTVNFNGASVPSDNVIMGNIDDADTKAVMHYSATKKYFGLGLSSDCHSYYTPNAIAIIKNAAAMLIAGEDLTAEAASISVSIGSREWASFSSTYPLDFTGSGITAYKATADDGTAIHLQAVTKAPAMTGLLLNGTEGSHTVAVTSESIDDIIDNLLKAGPKTVSAAEAAAEKIYAFGVKNDKVGFVKAAEGYSVAFGKSYLDLTESSAKGVEFFAVDDAIIDDYTTGINAVNGSRFTVNGGMYNIAGQKVNENYKGIVIVNGKKYVNK